MMTTLSSPSTATDLSSSKTRRPRTVSNLLWQVQGWLFYAFLWLGLLWILLETAPIRFVIPLGNAELREIDLIVLAFLGLWAGRGILQGRLSHVSGSWLVYGLVLILLVPVPIGLAVGKPLATVLRDVRVPLYYATMLPMLDVLRNYADLQRLQRFIVMTGFVSMLTSIGLWLASRFTNAAESAAQRYGISSLNVMGIWLLFIAVAFILFGEAKSSLKRRAGVLAGLGLMQTYIANDVRSTYVGVLGGVLFLVGAPWLWQRRNWLIASLRRRWFKWGIVVSGLLLVWLPLLILLGSDLEARDIVINNRMLRRFYSLVDPTIEGYGAQNRDDRLLAVSYGFELGLRNYGLGLGYGDNPFVNLDQDQIYGLVHRNRLEGNPGNVIEGLLFFHNAFGWTFGRLGLWLATLYFFLVLAFIVRVRRVVWLVKLTSLRVFLLATLAFVIYTLISGFGGGGFFDYFGPGMVFWLVALATLIRGVSLAREE